MDIVDFEVRTVMGTKFRKSQMSDSEWAKLYPVEKKRINNHVYPLMGPEVAHMAVDFRGGSVQVKQKPHWGSGRFFLHHNGLAIMGAGPGQQTGTTFGYIYEKRKVIAKIVFGIDGSMRQKFEAY